MQIGCVASEESNKCSAKVTTIYPYDLHLSTNRQLILPTSPTA